MKTTYKITVISFISTLILLSSKSFAYDYEIDGIFYNIISESPAEVEVTHNGEGTYKKNIRIPQSVRINDVIYSVTKIGDLAFFNSPLDEVILNEGLSVIGNRSFGGTNIQSIVFPESIISIGETAFNGCSSLTYVELPIKLTRIEKETFMGCGSLESIVIHENVNYIDGSAFSYCLGLKYVYVLPTIPPSTNSSELFFPVPYDGFPVLYVNSNGIENYKNASPWNHSSIILPFSGEILCTPPSFSFSEEDYLLTITCSTQNASIYYTTDGTNPTQNSNKYSGPFIYFGNYSVTAISVLDGFHDSDIVFFERNDIPTPKPEVVISEDFIVSMKDIAPDTKIYWSTDASVTYGWGDEYNMSISKLYEGAFTLTQATHIYAFAVRDGWSNSAFVDANFFDDYYVNTPDIYDEVASDNSYKTITIVSNYDGTTIYYTLDGSDPNTSATRKEYTEPFKLDHNLTIKAISTFPGRINSTIAERYIGDIDSRFKRDGIYYRQIDNSVNNEVEVTSGDSGYSGEITIPQTVTNGGTTFNVLRIGDNAFYNQDNLTAISLPNTILSIGQHAFQNCDGLKSVNIPGSVKALEYEAFRECYNMEKVTFNEGLESIDYAVFYDNNNLNELVLPSTLKAIGEYAFGSCHSATKCALPDGVETIGSYAFINCGALSSINLPNSIKEIGANCFERCSALQSIKLPSSLSVIRSFLFNECRELVSVEIPASVQEIQNEAFRYCEKLTSVVIPEGVTAVTYGCFAECYALTSVSLPSTISTIEQYAFNNDRSLPTITLPASLTSIGYDAFQGNSSLKAVYLFATTPPTFTDNNALLGAAQQGATLYVPAEAVETYKNARSWQEFDPNIAAIGNLPAAQPTFFFENYTLTMSTQTAGATIYYTDDNTDPSTSSKQYSGPIDFLRNDTIRAIAVKDGLDNSPIGEFVKNDFKVTAPEITMEWVGEGTAEVTIKSPKPDDRLEDANYYFALRSWNWWDGDFLQSNETTLYDGKFTLKQATHVTSVAIRDGWLNSDISDANFYDGYYLNQPGIEWDFSTQTITINPNNDDATIYYTLDNSDPNTSQTRQQYSNPFTISRNLTIRVIAVQKGHFNSAVSERMVIDFDNRFFVDDIRYRLVDNTIENEVEVTGRDDGYSGKISIPESITYEGSTYRVTRVGTNAFYNCDGLTSIRLPETITSIGSYAFHECDGLTGIVLPSSVRTVEDNAFLYCRNLSSIRLPEGLTSLGYQVFGYCSSLGTINLPSTLEAIPEYAFYYCTRLLSAKIPESIKTIGNKAFFNCNILNSIIIPEGVTAIPDDCFNDCFELVSVTLPSTLKTIGNYAFNTCRSLTNIVIPASVENIYYWAFTECDALKAIYVYAFNPPALNNGNSFGDFFTPNEAHLYVPEGSQDVYNEAQYWNEFSSIEAIGNLPAAQPTFFYENFTLTISTQTAGATIYYTDDNTEPTTSSHRYTQPIDFLRNDTIRAIAVKDGMDNSPISEFVKNDYKVSAPEISVEEVGEGTFEVTIKNPTPDARLEDSKIYYTTKLRWGWATWPAESGDEMLQEGEPILYNGKFILRQATHVAAVATRTGWLNSPVTDANYYDGYTLNQPYIDWNWDSKTVTITPNNDNATVYYTIDSSDPNDSKTRKQYTGPFTLDRNLTVRAIAVQKGHFNSTISEYVITGFDNRFFAGDIRYRLVDNSVENEVEVTAKDDGYSGQVAIPESITHDGTTYRVTRIGNSAFYNCDGMTSIRLPETITSIGNEAFNECDGLTSIVMPASVRTIGDYAFQYCRNLSGITLPEGITSLGYQVFGYCSSLGAISLPSTLETIPERAFYYCTRLLSVKIPGSIKTIGNAAFFNCNMLSSIIIPEGVTAIPDDCFNDCFELVSVTLPSTLTTIGRYAFNTCRSLTSIVIPAEVKNIYYGAFTECDALNAMYIYAPTPPALNDRSVFGDFFTSTETNLFVPESAVTTYQGTDIWKGFSNIAAIGNLPVSQPTFYLENYTLTISSQTAGATIYYTDDNTDPTTGSKRYTQPFDFLRNDTIRAIAVKDGMENSPISELRKNDYKVSAPDIMMEWIGEGTAEITIKNPTPDARLEDSKIYYTTKMRWGWAAWPAESADEMLQDGEPVLYNGKFILRQATHVAAVATRAGWLNSPLTNANCYDGYTLNQPSIDWNSSTKTVTIDANNDGATAYYTLDGSDPNESATRKLYSGPFQVLRNHLVRAVAVKSEHFNSPVAEYSITGVDSRFQKDGFYYRLVDGTEENVVEVTNPAEGSYEGNLTIPESVASGGTTYRVARVGNNAFHNQTNLTSISIPPTVTSIGDNAFSYCYNLKSIDIPSSVKSIEGGAFHECSGLTEVVFHDGVETIAEDAFANCSNLLKVALPATLTTIGASAFQYCSSLTEVTFPQSLTTIGAYAFQSCTGLTTLDIPDSVTSIGEWAFNHNESLTSLHLPASLTKLPQDMLSCCYKLETVEIPASVQEIERGVFWGDAGLTHLILPEGLKYIAIMLFKGCTSLADVNLPSTVQTIESEAFSGCTALQSVILPAMLESIADLAFNGCTAITDVYSLNPTPPTIQSGTWSGVTANATLYVPSQDAVAAYEKASYWPNFKSIEVGGGLPCAQPMFYFENYTLSMTTQTAGATIYYTDDNTDPKTSATRKTYSEPVGFWKNDTIRAIAEKADMSPSPVGVFMRNDFKVADPEVSISRDLVITMTTEEPVPVTTRIYYIYKEGDGLPTRPSAADIAATCSLYDADGFRPARPGRLYAIALRDGWIASEWVGFDYYTNYNLAAPTFTENRTDSLLTVSAADGAVIYYTADNSDPTATLNPSRKVYTEPIHMERNDTIRAYAQKEGMFASEVSRHIISWVQLHQPVIEFTGIYCNITQDKPGSTIYYTTDETDPTKSSTRKVFTEPFVLTERTVIKAYAVKERYNDSEVASRTFDPTGKSCAKPSISADKTSNIVTMNTTTEGATIYYTTNGLTPTRNDKVYTEPFEVTQNQTIKAVAMMDTYYDSDVTTFDVDWFTVARPVITVDGIFVTMSCPTPDARIYYTTNGNLPTTEDNLYTDVLTMTADCTIKAFAVKDNFNESQVVTEVYVQADHTCGTPTFNRVPNTNYVSISSSPSDGTTIYYTLDGTAPTRDSQVFDKERIYIEVIENGTLRALAVNPKLFDSAVGEYAIDWFKVDKPRFAYDDEGRLVITCDTAGVTIYYAFDSEATTSSAVYREPIVLTDNRTVYAFGTRPHFHDSDMASHKPGAFVCDDVTYDYNGRYLTMTSTDGATIHYTLDGSDPTASSPAYAEPVEITALCTVKAIAMKQDYTDSNVTSYAVTYLFNGEDVDMSEAGHLEEAFKWLGGTEGLTSLPVSGQVDDDDIRFIKGITTLEHLDLSNATVAGKRLPGAAFAGMNIVSFQSPKEVGEIGEHLFQGCKRLAAIVWNASSAIPQSVLDDVVNPNLLLYVNSSNLAPSTYTGNLVIGGVATSIALSDAETGGAFYCPQRFYAQDIRYTHDYRQPTPDPALHAAQGWETLALPFDVQTVTHETRGELAPFAKGADRAKYKPFWLYTLTETGFVRASEIAAYTPYVISMPNHSSYADDYILAGKVTFSAADVYVEADQTRQGTWGSYDFVPSLQRMPLAPHIMNLNLNDYSGQDGTTYVNGSAFIPGLRDVKPFEAYIVNHSLQATPLRIGDLFEGGTTDIMAAEMDELGRTGQHEGVFDLTGRQISVSEADLRGRHLLERGLYIINGQKVVIK